MLLNRIPHSSTAGYDPIKGCLSPGTREELLDRIMRWVRSNEDANSQRLLWISGAAGLGKSAIVHTIAHRSRKAKVKQLGSFFAFSRNDTTRGPDVLFSTSARNIGDMNSQWREALYAVIKADESPEKTTSPQLQFDEMICDVASEVQSFLGPVPIIIDALDECGTQNDREVILSILYAGMSLLPSNFRIIVTSRPEPEINHQFGNVPAKVLHIDLHHESNTRNIDRDLSIYIRDKLSRVQQYLGPNDWWPALVAQSQGIFQWASTACTVYISKPQPAT